SPWYGSGRSDGGKIRKEIERSCDENRTALPRDFTGMREGLGGVGNDLDVREESASSQPQLGRRNRARIARGGRDEAIAQRRERGEHPVDVLVGENRGEEDVAPLRQARKEPAHPGEV